MKRGLFICVVALATAVFAEGTVLPVAPDKLEEFNKRTGGMVAPVDNGKRLLVMDARGDDKVPVEEIFKGAAQMLKIPHVVSPVKLELNSSPYGLCAEQKSDTRPAVILLYDRPGDPALSVYPENAIACINVNSLKHEEAAVYRSRLGKEYWRAVGFVFGAYGVQLPGCVLQPVFSVADLDAVKGHQLGPNRFNLVLRTANNLGILMSRQTTYLRACQEGWAPAPTNDIQRAIWDKFKADKERGPSRPLVIAPPNTKNVPAKK